MVRTRKVDILSTYQTAANRYCFIVEFVVNKSKFAEASEDVAASKVICSRFWSQRIAAGRSSVFTLGSAVVAPCSRSTKSRL